VPFHQTPLLSGFSCGNKNLDEFLISREVQEFEDAGLGRTFLVFFEGDLVAYYTLSNASLRTEYLRTVRAFSKGAEERADAFPAVMIGRFAVARQWHGQGVGRSLLAMIAVEALFQGRRSGIRLLVLEAKPESISFYQKCGFRLTKETARERGKRNRTMFLDLQALEALRS
jgi:GNAT superfamily N-acetyltransferase